MRRLIIITICAVFVCFVGILGIKLWEETSATYSFLARTAQLEKKAEQGDTKAQFTLGMRYYSKRDYEKAVHYYEIAAEQGYAEAQYHIGQMYSNGRGVTQDYEKAIYYYDLAARNGHLSAQTGLGSKYAAGMFGAEQDYKKARYYYELAAKQGDDVAQHMLDTMNLLGQGL